MRNAAYPAAIILAVSALIVTLLFIYNTQTGECWMDVEYPMWMLEAQDYDGGCVFVLPSEQAPPDADWRMYCTGLCTGPDPSDMRFPRP